MRNTLSAFQELHTPYLGSTVEIVCFHVGGYKMGGMEGNGRPLKEEVSLIVERWPWREKMGWMESGSHGRRK